jgi:hypothetical protein
MSRCGQNRTALYDSADEDRYAPAAVNGEGLSPGGEALKDNCGFGGVGGDHLGTSDRNAAVLAEAGFDFRKVVQAN